MLRFILPVETKNCTTKVVSSWNVRISTRHRNIRHFALTYVIDDPRSCQKRVTINLSTQTIHNILTVCSLNTSYTLTTILSLHVPDHRSVHDGCLRHKIYNPWTWPWIIWHDRTLQHFSNLCITNQSICAADDACTILTQRSMTSCLFWDFTQRWLIDTDVSRQSIGLVFKGDIPNEQRSCVYWWNLSRCSLNALCKLDISIIFYLHHLLCFVDLWLTFYGRIKQYEFL
jgi:hypothetical protein